MPQLSCAASARDRFRLLFEESSRRQGLPILRQLYQFNLHSLWAFEQTMLPYEAMDSMEGDACDMPKYSPANGTGLGKCK